MRPAASWSPLGRLQGPNQEPEVPRPHIPHSPHQVLWIPSTGPPGICSGPPPRQPEEPRPAWAPWARRLPRPQQEGVGCIGRRQLRALLMLGCGCGPRSRKGDSQGLGAVGQGHGRCRALLWPWAHPAALRAGPGMGAGGRAHGSAPFVALCLGFPGCAMEATATARDKSVRGRLEGERQAANTRQQTSV